MANKKYTLENYKEFCNKALIVPPLDDKNIEEWFENHKIRIVVGGYEIELDYFPDTVNEIEFTLKEIYNSMYGFATSSDN